MRRENVEEMTATQHQRITKTVNINVFIGCLKKMKEFSDTLTINLGTNIKHHTHTHTHTHTTARESPCSSTHTHTYTRGLTETHTHTHT